MKLTLPLIFVLAAALAGAGAGAAQDATAPRFEDHPAAEVLDGSPAPLDIVGTKPWKKQRSLLRAAAANGPNFAGVFTIATFACGHRCQQVVVLDARTGKAVGDLQTRTGARYRRDSMLLVANPAETILPGDKQTTTVYYTWVDGGFAKLGGE